MVIPLGLACGACCLFHHEHCFVEIRGYETYMKNDILIYSFLFLGMLFTDLSSSNQGMATLLMISVILACLAITLKIDNDKIELTVNKKLFLAMMEYCGLISVLVSLYCIKSSCLSLHAVIFGSRHSI